MLEHQHQQLHSMRDAFPSQPMKKMTPMLLTDDEHTNDNKNVSSSSAQKRNLAEMVKESGKRWASLFDEADDDDTESDDDDDDDDKSLLSYSSESEEETEIAHVLVKKAFSKTPSTLVFDVLLRSVIAEQAKKKIKLNHGKAQQSVQSSPSSAAAIDRVRLSSSAPNLPTLVTTQRRSAAATPPQLHPKDCLRQLFATQQEKTIKFHRFQSLPSSFFTALSPHHIRNYDSALVRAVRDHDLPYLQHQLSKQQSLFAGNKFGETILHSACRRPHAAPMVRLLLHQGQHPIRVCCDSGRTVLHDAAWTCTPDWALLDILLDACPDLLYICDHRGCTALEYVPASQHAAWCTYLMETRKWEGVKPRVLE